MTDAQTLLTRGAQSLVLMLMGYDQQMDDALTALRQTLKEQPVDQARFQSSLEAVEKIYDDLEQLRDRGVPTYAKAFEVLLADQDQSILEPLKKAEPVLTDLLKVAEPLARYINTLKQLDPVNTPDLADIRQRLMTRFRLLLKTLQQLGQGLESVEKAHQLLKGDPDWDTLDQLIGQIIEVISDQLVAEKRQFEGYLAALNEKLERITKLVEQDSDTLQAMHDLNTEFNLSLQDQMTEARRQIDEQTRIDALKDTLLSSLDRITQRLEEHQTAQMAQLNSLQSSRADMANQVAELEKENVSLMAALQKERQLSQRDALTQLPNRQAFQTRLDEEISRARRYQQSLSLAILDIDFFKRINDDFGHLVGDKVLRMVAKEMKRVSRESDFIARFGGEEFIMILPQTTQEQAYLAVDKMRAHIDDCPFNFQNRPVPVTFSAGVAERVENESIEDWLQRADDALYQSKGGGRNKVTAA